MTKLSTTLETASASKYLQQMCKHFAHKVPAEWNEETAKITFEPGICTMTAEDGGLAINLEGNTTEDAQRLIYVIESHLMRFAWREEVDLDWVNQDGEPVSKSTKVIELLTPEREELRKKRK